MEEETPNTPTENTPSEEDHPRRRTLHPLLAFAISTAFVIFVIFVVPRFVLFLLPQHPLAFEIASRGIPVLVIAAGYFVLVRYAERLELRWDRAVALPFDVGWFREFIAGCVIASAMIVACVLVIKVVGGLQLHATFNSAAVRHTVAVLIMTLVAALLEELMFRGYPFQRLAMGIGKVGAVIVFSILFGAIHLSNPGASLWGFINTIAIGVTFAIVYFRTNALWMPFGLHFGWNFVLGVVFGLPVSGLTIFATMVHGKATGPRWLTGGSYGIEASATGSAVIVIATVLLWLWLRPQQQAQIRKEDELQLPGIQ